MNVDVNCVNKAWVPTPLIVMGTTCMRCKFKNPNNREGLSFFSFDTYLTFLLAKAKIFYEVELNSIKYIIHNCAISPCHTLQREFHVPIDRSGMGKGGKLKWRYQFGYDKVRGRINAEFC